MHTSWSRWTQTAFLGKRQVQSELPLPKQFEEAAPAQTVDTVPLHRPQTWPCPHPKRESGSAGEMQPTDHKSIYLKVQSALEEPMAGVILEAVFRASFSSAQVGLVPS